MKRVSLFILALCAGTANANDDTSLKNVWVSGVEFQQVNHEYSIYGVDLDMQVNTMALFVGYEIPLDPNWKWRPNITVGKGITDDNNNNIVVFGDILADISGKIKSLVSLNSPFSYAISDSLAAVVTPKLARYDFFTQSQSIGSTSEAEWELGLGVGIEYQIDQRNTMNLSYSRIDDADVLSASYMIAF